MNQAIRVTSAALGVSAGIASIEHGFFEILQGNTRSQGLMLSSIGPPCQPALAWNNCEPAMTILPNFLITGILAVIFGLVTIVWSLAFVQRKHGGLTLILLSFGMLLFGGGFFPPLIGFIGGLAGTRINEPLTWTQEHLPDALTRWLAKLYPWTLLAYLVLVFGQLIVGYFFNDWLSRYMILNVSLILIFLLLSVPSAAAHDILIKRVFV